MVTTASFDELYQQLNAKQRQAVDAIEGVVMVLAGPGTGKTQVLAMRIAKILQETQMDPYNILCLTFTESGVAAMRKRLLSIIGTPAYYVRIHTFHSFCNEVIQEYPEKFSFARELEVISDVEQVSVMRAILDDLPGISPLKPFGNPYLFVPDVLGDIKSLKQEHISSEHYRTIIAALETLSAATAEALDEFLNLKANQRTEDNCRAVYDRIMSYEKQFPTLLAYFARVRYVYEGFEQGVAKADGARAASKVKTKFKNDLQRIMRGLTNQLPKQKALLPVYEQYQVKLQERGWYDYEDMLLFVVERFKTDEELLARYQEQFQYILVDEYQDTNGAQNEALYLLGQFHDNPNIFVVGDDKQSIYRFQGASLSNLLFLYERYRESVQVIVLEENYRSQPTILSAADAVMSHNQESVDRYIPNTRKPLIAQSPYQAAPVELLVFETEATEHHGITVTIQGLLKDGISPTEIAVLYRRNADAHELADSLLKLDIPVHVEIDDNIFDDRLIQQLITVFQYLAYPDRLPTLWQILHYPFWQLPALDLLLLNAYANQHAVPLNVVISTESHLKQIELQQPEAMRTLGSQLARWQQLAITETVPNFLAQFLAESGIVQKLTTDEQYLEKLTRLHALFTTAKNLTRKQRTTSLADFLSHLTILAEYNLKVTTDRLQTNRQAVRLMTAHRSKGQEFGSVFITGLIDRHWGNLRERNMVPLPHGLLPYDPVVGTMNNEDERRLFYVAMTRAKEKLYLTYAQHNEKNRELVPAIFVTEIPPETLQQTDVTEVEEQALARLQLIVPPPVVATSETRIRQFVTSLLESYVLSVTHLNAYLTCPRLFYNRYLLRVPTVRTKHMAFGTATHAALYDFYATVTVDSVPPVEQLVRSFEVHLARENLKQVDYRDCLDIGRAMLRDYYAAYHLNCSRRNLLEYNFASHGVTVKGIPLTGKIDKIEVTDKAAGSVNVVEYKTGNPDTRKANLKTGEGSYWRQLAFYKLLCDGSPRFPYTMQTGEIDFIERSPTTNKFVKKKFTITDKDTEALTMLIEQVWREVHELQFLDPPAEKLCGKCEYCRVAG